MKLVKRMWNSFRRLRGAGLKVFPYLLVVLLGIGLMWLLVQRSAPASASPYTTAVFLGAFLATAMVTVHLAVSPDFEELANMERRLGDQHAVIALLFDARGRVLVRFQSDHPYPATSWREYWVPPGGLGKDAADGKAAQERLRLLVDEAHPWGEATHVASTNDSPAYHRANRKEGQVPVQVEAYWVQWSEEDPWVPEGVYDDLNHRELRLAGEDAMPEPVPPYYPELFEYFDAVWTGKVRPELKYWTRPNAKGLEAMLNGGT